MSRSRLRSLIARATGESPRTIRQRGFSLLRLEIPLAPVSLQLYLACPGCGSEIPLASNDDGILPEWAECDECDIAYPYQDEELFLPEEEFAASA